MQEAPGTSSFTVISGATSASYTTPATTANNSGTQYECVVSNALGSITSNSVTLTVNVVPSISTQPVNVTVTAPATATFTVAASGTPTPAYQWMQEAPGAGTFSAISGATSASYTTPATTAANSGTQFECVVSNAAGSATSNAATLTVNVLPSIIIQPVNATVIAPATATFTVAASGTPAPTYQWMQEVPGAGTFTAISGATSTSYTTPATTAVNNGTQYECVISNVAGSVTTNAVTLTVNSAITPSITTQPANVTLAAPATATFTVVATGTPTPTYQWMQEAPGAGTFTAISGATSASYTTPATTTANSGTQFECVVTNNAGSVTSNAVTLTVTGLPVVLITSPANNSTVQAGSNVTITATASEVNGTISSVAFYNGATLLGTKTSSPYSLTVTSISAGTDTLTAIATDVNGISTTSLTVTLLVRGLPVVSITNPLNNSYFLAGATIPLSVNASEVNGTITSVRYANNLGTIGTSSASPFTLNWTNVSARTYTVVAFATDAIGNSTESAAVTVNVVSNAPVVTITSPANNSNLSLGSNVTITASASETGGTISNVSFYNGATLLGTSTGSSYSYTIANIAAGTYNLTAVATDIHGLSTTSSIVTVNVSSNAPAVAITSPTNNSIVSPGSNLTITAFAGETGGTISSVSFYNGTTLLGTSTSSPYSYTITNVPEGTYNLTAVATDVNDFSTTSSLVTVTAEFVPVVTITSPTTNSTLSAGSNLTIIASASETGGGTISSVAFYNGSTLLGTSTTSPYSYTITSALVGNYSLTAIATDVNSVSTTSAPVTLTVTGQPVVSLVSPANNSTFTTGSLGVTAFASENYGAITNVKFYNGTTLIGTVTSNSQAFTYFWNNVPAGNYSLSAVATDTIGATVTSSVVTGTINSSSTAIDDNVASKTDARGNTTSYQYDQDNRLVKTIFADSSTVSEAYDLFGNQISVTDQRGNTLTKTYDPYERLAQTKDPLGDITQFNYDTNGDLLTLTDANGDPTTYTYDADYRVLTQTNALNFTMAYTYDPVGNVSSRTDANGKVTNYTYDALNRLTNTVYPDATQVTVAYDALGRKSLLTDSTGQTTYTYDALSRLLTKTSPGTSNTITYTYDSEGNRLTSVDQNSRTITNTYDTLNRLATVTDPNGKTSYGYDADSNKLSVASPNGVTESYTYDPLNRVLTAVNEKGSTVISSFSNVYDIAGMITKKTFVDGSSTAYSYDAINRLLEETKQNSSSIIYDYVYTYDPVGNRLTWTKNTTLGGFWNVDYLNMPPQVLTNMTTAGYGNTASPTQPTTLARNYTYDAGNRLTGWNYAVNINSVSFPIQTDTYSYDNNGNRLIKQVVLTGETTTPQQATYSYDFENRLQNLSLPNASVGSPDTLSYTYNGEGLRTQAVLDSVTSNYLYDGTNILVERNGSGTTTKSYTRGLDIGGGIGSLINQNIPGTTPTTQYYDYNDLGSTADTTTSTGAAANSYSYDAFGNLLAPQASTDTNRYLFSTKEFDSRSGLSFFGGRYYDPEIGRWLTPDPAGFINGPNMYAYVDSVGEPLPNSQFTNLYVYAENNPVNMVDPDGRTAKKKNNIYYTWEECDAADMAECILQCEEMGVESCKSKYKFSTTIRDSQPTITVTKLPPPSCNCNERKDEGSCGNTNLPGPEQTPSDPVNEPEPPMSTLNPYEQ